MSPSICRLAALFSRVRVMRMLVSSCLAAGIATPASHAAAAEAGPPAAAPVAASARNAPPSTTDPFASYQTWRDTPVQDWRGSNDRVGEIGGWRTYLREAQPAGDEAEKSGQGRMHDHSSHGGEPPADDKAAPGSHAQTHDHGQGIAQPAADEARKSGHGRMHDHADHGGDMR